MKISDTWPGLVPLGEASGRQGRNKLTGSLLIVDSDCMDEEIADALFGDDDGEFEELDDDFVIQAAEVPT